VIGAITRIVGCLAIIVVLFHDGVVLGLAQITTDQDAQLAARAAAQSWSASPDLQKAYDAAALSVASKGTDIDTESFKIDANGLVTLTAHRTTSTMVADHLSWFDSLTHPHSIATATVEKN